MENTAQSASDTPRISVLMALYNADAFVADAIESILAQTVADFELLILDDGSTDRSAEVVATYAEKDARIRFWGRENRGAPATRNEMAAAARAPYLAVMDADDISLPDRFERQIVFLEAHPEVVAVGGQSLLSDEDMRPIHVPRMPTDHDEIDDNHLSGVVSMAHSGLFMRAEAFHEVGGYDEGAPYSEDLDLWLRLAEIGRLANLPDVVVKYRLHENSICGRNGSQQLEDWRKASGAAWKRRGIPDREISLNEWRPTHDPSSQLDFTVSWGWRAWRAGNRDTARHFFLKALRSNPLSPDAWKGLIFGTLRRPD